MVTTYRVQLPLTEEQVRSFDLGDMVSLSGEIVITAGLPTHQRMIEKIDAGEPMPIDMTGAALIHFGGQTREVDGRVKILYMNPTTSTRFNPYMPKIISSFGLRVVGGKGGLHAESVRAMKETGCIYLSFPGGGCTLLSNAIRETVSVNWSDLLMHYRLVQVRVEDLGPGTVAIDARGNSLFDILRAQANDRLPAIMEALNIARGMAKGG